MLSAELKAFYTVALLGSVTQAAKKLGLSQPTVTTQIRQLESRYAVELFYRGGRRLTVSDEGARLLPKVKVLLQHEADIEFHLRNCGQGRGALRIGATAPYYILDLVKTFRERLPHIDVSVEIGNSQDVLEALEEYRVDLAASSQWLEDPRLMHLVLGTDPLVLAVHKQHPLAVHDCVPPILEHPSGSPCYRTGNRQPRIHSRGRSAQYRCESHCPPGGTRQSGSANHRGGRRAADRRVSVLPQGSQAGTFARRLSRRRSRQS
jgi:DNA-binding transcriptional LysR family regulator